MVVDDWNDIFNFFWQVTKKALEFNKHHDFICGKFLITFKGSINHVKKKIGVKRFQKWEFSHHLFRWAYIIFFLLLNNFYYYNPMMYVNGVQEQKQKDWGLLLTGIIKKDIKILLTPDLFTKKAHIFFIVLIKD